MDLFMNPLNKQVIMIEGIFSRSVSKKLQRTIISLRLYLNISFEMNFSDYLDACISLTLYHIVLSFTDPETEIFGKSYGKRRKCL